MNSYYSLELLANAHMRERQAEAEHERMLAEARRANAVVPGRFAARIARFMRMRVPGGGALAQENRDMSDVLVGLCILGAVVVLDVLAILFGYDSRDGFRSSRR